MIQINPDKMVRIELTPKEQKTILKHCHSLDMDTYDRILNAEDGVLHFLIEDLHHIRECIRVEVDRAGKPKVQDILGNLYNKLSPNPATRILAEELGDQSFENIENANEKLQEVMKARNAAPDAELGGLSPDQVSRLIYLSWDDDGFPLKFNKKLELSEPKNSVLFANAVICLNTLVELKNENTATAAGNLNRKFVKLIFDRLIIPEDEKKSILEYNKVINETDVFPLHIARVVCQSAGLIHKRKNKFLVPKKYHSLLADERAGELYVLLFNSYFTKFNIGYVDRLPELASIQHTIAYSIHRLGEIADSYTDVKRLSEEILLPSVLKEVRGGISKYVKIEWILRSRILEPLIDFGLVECKYKQFKGYSSVDAVRKTQLFDRFIRCEW
ncbi:MAG: hypothetical protein J7M40_09170 [Planctomycetes bacterium]|nr:hypothetical protein [Planctomycetota bacterium]